MKIVVIGGTGLIGSGVVAVLRERGHDAVAAAPNTGVNTLTGEGLAEALVGASVVVDVSNSPSFEATAAMEFFETATRNILAAEAAAGVAHHVALSVVGSERLVESGYFPAKVAQEKLIKSSSIPYSIVRATQFFEFVNSIADTAVADADAVGPAGAPVGVAPVAFRPIAAHDVSVAVAEAALGAPLNNTVEVAGPDEFRLDALVRENLAARGIDREVVSDPHGRYFGAELGERTLVPGDGTHLAATRYEDWLRSQA